tara:strand:+ start:28 stop:387 length:360 start_codon:yes stop_codon:yes gene_type:complete
MKKAILIILLTIPFLGFGQGISGTGWKLTDQDGDKKIILFEEDKSFTYLNILSQSGNSGKVYNDEEDTWMLADDNIIISFSNGYKIYSGQINSTRDYMSGTMLNKAGNSGTWSATLIKF